MIIKGVHRTRIIPLRYIANLCSRIGATHINKLFDMQEELGKPNMFAWNYHVFMWGWTHAVSQKWGTYYEVINLD